MLQNLFKKKCKCIISFYLKKNLLKEIKEMSFNINMSNSTLRKIKKNVAYLESIRPVKTSQYRSTADDIIIRYAILRQQKI